MILKKHKTPDCKLLIALCDEDLVGKKFEEGDFVLDLSSNFYRGEKVNDSEAKKVLSQAYLVNVVGKKSIDFCKKNDFLKDAKIVTIKNVPHAQIIMFSE